jgi:hypothetical protein
MVRAVLMACIALLATGSLHAQARYVCRVGGTTHISDRPCSAEGGQVHYGALQQPVPRAPAPIGMAPSHLQYMSPRCASLNDAIRTGYARGLKPETMATMRRDYYQECGDDEREAMQELSRARTENRTQQAQARVAQREATERSKAQEQRCAESRRIIANKKARTDLSDGEKGDLRRFEENHLARCS